jgi:hypothetical protein
MWNICRIFVQTGAFAYAPGRHHEGRLRGMNGALTGRWTHNARGAMVGSSQIGAGLEVDVR